MTGEPWQIAPRRLQKLYAQRTVAAAIAHIIRNWSRRRSRELARRKLQQQQQASETINYTESDGVGVKKNKQANNKKMIVGRYRPTAWRGNWSGVDLLRRIERWRTDLIRRLCGWYCKGSASCLKQAHNSNRRFKNILYLKLEHSLFILHYLNADFTSVKIYSFVAHITPRYLHRYFILFYIAF